MSLQVEDLHLALELVTDASTLLHPLGEEKYTVDQLNPSQVTLDEIVSDRIRNVLDGHGELNTSSILQLDGLVAELLDHLRPQQADDHTLAPQVRITGPESPGDEVDKVEHSVQVDTHFAVSGRPLQHLVDEILGPLDGCTARNTSLLLCYYVLTLLIDFVGFDLLDNELGSIAHHNRSEGEG